jgi:branched-chain amino acid transport system permease protein
VSIVLQFIVLGLGLGAVYIGLAGGMLLVYRATGIINFAQGAMAVWGVYVFAQLRLDGTLVLPIGSIKFPEPPPVGVAILLGLLSAILIGLLMHFLVFRPVRRAPALAQVVVSVAALLTLQALVVIRFGPNDIPVESVIPRGTIDLFGVPLSSAEIMMAAVMVVCAALIWAYFRLTKAGVSTRAAAENERGAVLLGYSPDLLAGIAMVVGALVSTIGVMLGASLTGLNPVNYALMIVPALAVLLVAKLESIWGVVIASIVLGAVQSLLGLLASFNWWPDWAKSGVDQVVPFLVVMAILFLFGRRLPSRGRQQTIKLPDVKVPRPRPIPILITFAVVALLLVVTTGTARFGLTMSIILMLLALSYVVITGYLGQISLAQVAFAGAAGFALSKATTEWNIPFPLSLLVCSLIAAALGALVALPAFRIRGAQLAIVTIAAALAIERFLFNNYALTPPSGNPIGQPSLFGLDLSVRGGSDIARLPFSLMVLVVATIVVLGYMRLASGDTGRTFLAVRSNERAAASSGINVQATKLVGFVVSAFIAGVAGCLLGYSAGQLSTASFTVAVGLQILAIAYLGGITTFSGAAIAGVIAPAGVIFVLLNTAFNLNDYYALISGILLILTAILNPVGVAGAMSGLGRSIGARMQRRRGVAPTASHTLPEPAATEMIGANDGK